MCGRYAIDLTPEELLRQKPNLPEPYLQDIFKEEWHRYQSYDARPTTRRIVIPAGENPQPRAMRWGWTQTWTSKPMINARWETAPDKKEFAQAVLHSRCVVPATAYYEWRRDERDRPQEKYAFRTTDGSMLRIAGLWETAKLPSGETEERFLVLTRKMVLHGQIHDRTPVLLTSAAMVVWLDPKASEAEVHEAAAAMTDHDVIYRKVIRNAQAERDNRPDLMSPTDEPWPW